MPRRLALLVSLACLAALSLAPASQAATLDAGGEHACAVKTDGTVWCWGSNDFGQLGRVDPLPSATPLQIPGITDATSVASGGAFSCALRAGGSVVCWGQNLYGQLGRGSVSTTAAGNATPEPVTGLSGVASIAAGGYHACATKTDGSAWCWGNNDNGELGDGSATPSTSPVRVQGLTQATAISAGTVNTCALDSAQGLLCWGDNSVGQLAVASSPPPASTTPVVIGGVPSPIQVSVGDSHVCALTAARSVFCWGGGSARQLGDSTTNDSATPTEVAGVSGVVSVTAGGLHTCVATQAGSTECWGTSTSGQLGLGTSPSSGAPSTVANLAGAVAVTAGNAYTCAVLTGDSVACWGDGYTGQLGDGITAVTTAAGTPVSVSSLGNLRSLSVSSQNGCAATTGGDVYCWGWGGLGVLGTGAPAAMAVSPVQVPGITQAKSVGVGYAYACALTTGGAVWCWGAGTTGQMGNGTTPTVSAPVQVSGISTATQLSVGAFTACALLANNTIKCWGSNTTGSDLSGQLGHGGSDAFVATPVSVASDTGLTSASAVVVGPSNACAISGTTGTGALYCWGDDSQEQLGPGYSASQGRPRPVSGFGSSVTGVGVGSAHVCALQSTGGGTIKCWGSDGFGQLGNGSADSSGETAVSATGSGYSLVVAGAFHTCALASGTVKCWGDNSLAEIGDGSITNRDSPVTVPGLSGIDTLSLGIGNTCAYAANTSSAWCWGDGYYGQLGDGNFPTGHAGLSGVVKAISGFSLRVAPVTPPGGGTTPTTPPTTPVATLRVVNGKLALTAFVLNPLGKSCPSRVTVRVSVGKVKQTARGKTTATTAAGKLSCTVTFKFKLSSKVKKAGRKAKRVTVQVSGSGVATTRTRVKWAS